jgi:tetratricopeptide (TPR) repeat protein
MMRLRVRRILAQTQPHTQSLCRKHARLIIQILGVRMGQRKIRLQSRAKKITTRPESKARTSTGTITLGLVLLVATLAVYGQVRSHEFINYDDNDYVLNNSHVKMGLGWETVRWSLVSREEANWHPLTWWSHALDYDLFGLDPGYHHLTSVVIHAVNALLLFLLLRAVSRATVPSFVVAVLFALHPFNVESVAWVAERKNLLCTLFFLLTLAAYGWYTRQPRLKSFAVVTGAFVLALASKPMAVTLPLVLLLLDYWPLQRVAGWIEPNPRIAISQEPLSKLLLEKLPLFALSALSSAVTVWAQSSSALRSMQAFPFGERLENALCAYAIYIGKTFWPLRFALFYPHPGSSLPFWKPALAAGLLCSVSIAVWMQRVVRPYLIVGWLWFLGVLFPMIGIVQVGDQAMADRYAYLSTVGLFVMIVWGAFDLFDRLGVRTTVRWVPTVAILIALWCLTFRQISYWENSVAVWSHTLEVTSANPLAEDKLGFALAARGDNEEAMPHFLSAVRLDPKDVGVRVNLGAYYAAHARLQDAIQQFQTAVDLTDDKELRPEDRGYRCSALMDLGFADTILNDYPKALMNLQAANQSDPLVVNRTGEAITHSLASAPSEDGYVKLSLLLRAEGEDRKATAALEDALNAHPQYSRAREVLDFLNAGRN